MPAYTASHVKDDEDNECPEIVGSKDLREVFKDKERLRGSFSINGYMLHQFEANSIENLLAQLGNAANRTHVDASIDDGYHLVLEARSPGPIVIRRGPAYQDVPPPGADPVAKQVVETLKADRSQREKDEEDRKPKNTILEDLGLEETEQDSDNPQTLAPGTPPPGMKAEERQKRREERAKVARGEIPPGDENRPGGPIPAGQTPLENVSANPSTPITGTGTDRTLDDRNRTGQGTGYDQKPDGTPPVPGTQDRYQPGQGLQHPS